MRSLTFSTSISEINRIGVRRSKALSENEIHSVQDLLYTFPRRHLDRRSVSQIKSLQKDTQASIVGAIQSMGEKPIRRGKLFQVILSDGTRLRLMVQLSSLMLVARP
jgi:RecG-like helicase